MSLQKDDLVELIQQNDDGWWLVRKDGGEGWAPHNYLELVPPKPKAAAPPPPPPGRRPVPSAPNTKPTASAMPKVIPQSLTANASAKPVSVFPGVTPSDGSSAPWKKPASHTSGDYSPASSKPSSVTGKPLPSVADRPKPPIAVKPAPKPPAVPTAPRPNAASRGGGAKPAGAHADLAAIVRGH